MKDTFHIPTIVFVDIIGNLDGDNEMVSSPVRRPNDQLASVSGRKVLDCRLRGNVLEQRVVNFSRDKSTLSVVGVDRVLKPILLELVKRPVKG